MPCTVHRHTAHKPGAASSQQAFYDPCALTPHRHLHLRPFRKQALKVQAAAKHAANMQRMQQIMGQQQGLFRQAELEEARKKEALQQKVGQ